MAVKRGKPARMGRGGDQEATKAGLGGGGRGEEPGVLGKVDVERSRTRTSTQMIADNGTFNGEVGKGTRKEFEEGLVDAGAGRLDEGGQRP